MGTAPDIVVCGGGIAGLTATLALAHAGARVLCCDPAPAGATSGDHRTTAFLQPARALLADICLWDRLADAATPLQVMALADLSDDGVIRAHRAFDAADISDQPFGWNIANRDIRAALLDEIAQRGDVDLRAGVSARSMLARSSGALVRLSDGTKVPCALVVAADGRNSQMRAGAGIGVRTWRYGQQALVFTVTHAQDHNETSTEIHRRGGPFTLVPLSPRADGTPRSSVVWMEAAPQAKALAALPAAEFGDAANERSGGVLGKLDPEGPPQVWPIITQLADSLTFERLALIAEAAHVVPPIGAQGLNTSLADIRTLRDLVAAGSTGDLGSQAMLDTYARKRRPAIEARVRGIDALNRASMAGDTLARDLRGELMKMLHDITPIRKALMRAGLG